MASSPIFSGETKVAIMRRVLRDGTVEIYSDSASKAQTDPEHCIDCCTAEECLETYGIEVDTRKSSKTAKSSNIPRHSNYWKSPEMPTPTNMTIPSSATTSTARHGNDHAFSTISYHVTTEDPSHSSSANNIASSDLDAAFQVEPFHYHSAHTVGSVYSLAAAAAAAATHHRYGQYPFAIVINQTPYLTEDDKRAVHAAMTSRERLPRSDFTPDEQAAWEEREWMAMQEDEYERDVEAPLPSETYRSRNLSPEEDEYRGFADARGVESDRESLGSFDAVHGSRRGSFTSDDFPASHGNLLAECRRLREEELRRFADMDAGRVESGRDTAVHSRRGSVVSNGEPSTRRYSMDSDRESLGSVNTAVHGSRRGSFTSDDFPTYPSNHRRRRRSPSPSVASTDYYTCHSNEEF